jgi:hypothetical protein
VKTSCHLASYPLPLPIFIVTKYMDFPFVICSLLCVHVLKLVGLEAFEIHSRDQGMIFSAIKKIEPFINSKAEKRKFFIIVFGYLHEL